MKNTSKRASALVLLLLLLFCQYATTIEIRGRFNTRTLRSFQNGRHVKPTEVGTSNETLHGPLPLTEKRRYLASFTATTVTDNEQKTKCRLSQAVLAQITRPSASEWLVDDGTVKLLQSNLNELISCTKQFDKVFFNTTTVIKLTETIEIPHELEFLRMPQTTFEVKNSTMDTTLFTCPTSSPVFLVDTSNFTAVGIRIANCEKSSSRGTIILRTHSAATLKHARIEDNNITGLYINKNANVTLLDAHFARNEIVGNGAAIHSKRNAYITIADSTFVGNLAKDGRGGAIFIGISNAIVINGSKIAGNQASDYNSRGGGLLVRSETTLSMFECEVTNNGADRGGGISLRSNNFAIIHKTVFSLNNAGSFGGAICFWENTTVATTDCILSNNTAYDGGAAYAFQNNTLTMIDCVLSNDTAQQGGAISSIRRNTLTIIDCVFANNTATYEIGGGILVGSEENVFMQGCVFSNNHAGFGGGGITLTQGNDVIMQECELSNNNAPYGGAIYFYRNNVLGTFDCIFSNNTADEFGGGIELVEHNNAFMLRCELSNNNAMVGGALYAYNDNQATIVDSILSNNTGEYTTKYGKGLYVIDRNNSVTVKNTTITKGTNHKEGKHHFLLSQ